MSEAQNFTETKDLPPFSTRRYETDNLISPSGSQQPCVSPNATILSHLEINNCKSFREIQSNQDLDGMLSHNPLQQPQDTQISLQREDIIESNYVDSGVYGQKDLNSGPNENKQKPRQFKDKFSALGVIVPSKHIFEPLKSTDIKEPGMEMNQGSGEQEHILKNEVNTLILTDERVIPKRSVSIIGNSDSVDSPRKVSNQSTKTQQLTPKPVKRKLGSGRKSMALLSNNSPRQSPSPTRNKSGRVVPLGLNEESSIDRQGTGKQNMYVQMKKSIRFSGCGEPSVQGSNATLSQKYQQQQQQSGVLISPTNNSPNGRDDRRGNSPSISPLLKQQTSESSGVGNLLWKWGIASRVKMINRFYQRVKNQTSQINFKFLQRFHFDLIDDKSYFFDVSQVSSSGKSQKARLIPSIAIHLYWILKRNLCSMPVLSANSSILMLWRLIYSSLLVIQMFLVPFQICFDIAFNSADEWSLLYYGPLVAYCFNILVQLNSGYYEMGQEQLDRSKVFANYKYQFLIDLLAILAFILTNTFSNPYFNICFYLKMNQLYANISDIVEHFQVHQKFSLVYTLSRLMFLILFLAHACGCVFLLISQQEYDSGNQSTWIVNSNIQNASTFKRYLNSLYFSVITMVTVGYGDIRPIADTEKMFVIFMALLGSVVFGYVVNTIGGIFQELAQKEADFKKKKYDLSNFMTSRQIKQETQVKVMKYLDYMKMQDEDNPLRGENFLELVSKNLQEDIQRDFYGRIIRQHKLFSTHFTIPFLNAISLHFKERVLGPGEMFFEQGFIGQSDIYFIQKGKVEIFCANGTQTKSLIVNKQGEYFGQGEFFSSLPRSSSAKSITTTHVLVLPQQKFTSLLKDFPQDFEIFHKLKDDLLLYKISENNKACVSCGKFNHSLIDCHYLHYKRNHDLLIARYTYSIPNQGEKSFIRGFQKTKNAFKENEDVNRDLRRYRIDIYEELLNKQYMAIDEDERQENLQPNVHRNSLMGVSDKKFFLMLKKLKYEEQKFVLCSDEDDLEGSLRNITEISQSEDDQENDGSEENQENEEENSEEEQGEGETSENYSTEGGDIQEIGEEEEEDDDTKGKNGKGKKEFAGSIGEQNSSMRKGSKFIENLGQGEISTIQEVDESKKGSQTGNIFQDKLLEYIETLPKNEENSRKNGDEVEDKQSDKLSKSQLPPSSDSSSSSSSDTPQSSEIKILPQFGAPKENSKNQDSLKNNNSKKKQAKKSNHSCSSPSSSSSSSSSGSSSSSSSSSSESEQSHSKKYITKTILNEEKHSAKNNTKPKKHKQIHHLPQLEKKKHTNHEHSQQASKKQSTSLSQLPQDLSQSNNNSKGGVASSMSQNNGTSSLSQKSISFCKQNNSPRSMGSQKQQHKHSHHHLHHHKDKHLSQNILESSKISNSAGDKISIQPSQEIPLAAELSDDTQQQRNITFNNLIEISHDDQTNLAEGEYQSYRKSEKPSKGFRRQESKVLTFHRSSKVAKPPSASRLEDIDPSGSFFRGVTSEEETGNIQKPISTVTATFIPQSPVSRQEYSSLQQEFSSLQQEFSAFQQSQQQYAQIQQQKQSQSMGMSLTHNSKNSRKQSQSAFSEPSLFSERMKKKSFLTRDQSFKSKYSRDSRLLRACDLDDLVSFKNKVPLQKMNSGSVSRFSNAFAEWNATPILKNINGIRDSSDFESSMSLGGVFSPMRSFKLKKGQLLAHAFSRNSNLFASASDEEQSHINGGLGLNGINNQNLPSNSNSNNNNNGVQKKSKFSSNNTTTTRRRSSTSEDTQVGGGIIQALKAKQQQQQQQQQLQQVAQTNGSTQQQSQQQQQNKSLESIGVLPNIERIKKEQERIRRNSPLLLTRNNLVPKRRQSLHGTNFHNQLQNNQNSNVNQQTSSSGGSVSGSLNGANPTNSNLPNGNSNNSNLPQNALNEEHLVRRLKEILQGQEDEKAPLDGMYSQRGSRMYGVGQDYLVNPLILDHNMFFMPDFDIMKEYELYYKNNNYSQVLRKIKGKQKNKRFLQQRVQKKKLLTIYRASSITKIEA